MHFLFGFGFSLSLFFLVEEVRCLLWKVTGFSSNSLRCCFCALVICPLYFPSSVPSAQGSGLERHMAMTSDLSQGGAADMSPLSRDTPGGIASHHSTPGAASSSMIDMVAAAAAISSSEPVMQSPLATQQTVVSGRVRVLHLEESIGTSHASHVDLGCYMHVCQTLSALHCTCMFSDCSQKSVLILLVAAA